MSRFQGRNAIVTGAGSGIGRAIALRLAVEGAQVVVNDLNADAAEATVGSIKALGYTGSAAPGDVSNPDDMNAIFGLCEREFGPCHILVNNAGIAQQTRFQDLGVDDWDKMINVHLRGCFLGCRRALETMVDHRNGSIINIASQLGQIGGVELSHYAAAKAGIIGLTKSLAREVSQHGVRVNAVAPGPINTELVMKLSEDWRREKAGELPLGTFGEPEDVAATVAFLASDDARLYVGQTLGPNSGDVML